MTATNELQDTALRYFLEVAQCGSVSLASQRLHVAMSAISRQIANLELQLGTPLFERHARGMVPTAAGEILEIAAQRRVDSTSADYEDMVRGKTAWLIRAACEMGALAAGADDASVAAAAAYGENLGMAFQMVDDALDFAPESVTGKPTGGDVREGKLTPPLRLYRDSLSTEERSAFDAAFCAGLMTEADAASIAESIRQAGYDDAVRRQADEFLDAARQALETLPDRPERELMRQMADYVRDRKK